MLIGFTPCFISIAAIRVVFEQSKLILRATYNISWRFLIWLNIEDPYILQNGVFSDEWHT